MSTTAPIAIKNGDITSLMTSLNALDGLKVESHGQIINRPYKIKGAVRIRIGKWLKAISDQQKIIEVAHTSLVKQYCHKAGPDGKDAERVPPESLLSFHEDLKKMMEEATEFPHAKLKYADVLGEGLEENAIDGSVLAGLSPIMED